MIKFPNPKIFIPIVIFAILLTMFICSRCGAETQPKKDYLASLKKANQILPSVAGHVIPPTINPIYTKGGLSWVASWYSIASLKKEGTYKYSKGVMANGENFNENNLTCATRLYPLGSILRITNIESGKEVIVRVTDRIGKRFATKRIDLSKLAFSRIAKLSRGIISVKVEQIN